MSGVTSRMAGVVRNNPQPHVSPFTDMFYSEYRFQIKPFITKSKSYSRCGLEMHKTGVFTGIWLSVLFCHVGALLFVASVIPRTLSPCFRTWQPAPKPLSHEIQIKLF